MPRFIKSLLNRAWDSFSRARGIVELMLFFVFLCSMPFSAKVVWLVGVVLFFGVFIVEICFLAPYRPPPMEFKLTILPGYHIRPDDPNSVFVNLSLSNDSTPPAELHNIDGEYWRNTGSGKISESRQRPAALLDIRPSEILSGTGFVGLNLICVIPLFRILFSGEQVD